MCVCVYRFLHLVYIYIYIYAFIYIYMYVCVYIWIFYTLFPYVCVHIYMHVCTLIYAYTRTHIYFQEYWKNFYLLFLINFPSFYLLGMFFLWICMCIYTHINMYVHLCIYTHICFLRPLGGFNLCENSFDSLHRCTYLPAHLSGRIWHKVNFLTKFNWFEFSFLFSKLVV